MRVKRMRERRKNRVKVKKTKENFKERIGEKEECEKRRRKGRAKNSK